MNEIVFSSWGNEIIDKRKQASGEAALSIELPEYFKKDEKIRALIGWYGIVLRSDDVDIIDLCRSYMAAVYRESCGNPSVEPICPRHCGVC